MSSIITNTRLVLELSSNCLLKIGSIVQWNIIQLIYGNTTNQPEIRNLSLQLSSKDLDFVEKAINSSCPHKWRSKWVKSGERGRQNDVPYLPIHLLLNYCPEWPHRQGGCLACCGCTFDFRWGCTDLYYARGAQGVLLMRVGGATTQLDLQSLTPLSVAGCGWL